MRNPRYAGETNAPDFRPESDWVNAPHALSLMEFRGKLVLLDFWTYCCINCAHMLPHLKRLQKKFAREIVVIGVHAAKFPAERETSAVAEAVQRMSVTHPVVNDADHYLRERYAVSAWPTLVFVNPVGKVVAGHAGEFAPAALFDVVASMVAEFTALGTLKRSPLLAVPAEPPVDGLLRYPGKAIFSLDGTTRFVADTGHHRVVELDANGELLRAFGDGKRGLTSGTATRARFDSPQGLALHGESLYVADTGNHAIRRIDLIAGRIETVAGTGERAAPMSPGGPCLTTPLASPWDIAVTGVGLRLLVAMAGLHQIWEIDLANNESRPFAGRGVESLRDGPRTEADFAQPLGIALDEIGKRLFVADAESSAIREVTLGPGGEVRTIVGEGLFDFGDADGLPSVARLQHPQGVAWDGAHVWVADSYNGKLRRIDPETGRVTTIAEGFAEPGGVAVQRGRLLVAETNGHRVRIV